MSRRWAVDKRQKVENIDDALTTRLKESKHLVRCPDGHLNSKTAIICWKCGKSIKKEGAD